jgi:hypothetical protein
MRSLTITAAVAAAAAVLLASPGALKSERSVVAAVAPTGAAATGDTCPDAPPRGRKVSDISWFQGTLEEAFTRHAHSDHRPWFHF